MKFTKTRADIIREEMNQIECAYDGALPPAYDALARELAALPREPYNKERHQLCMMQKTVQTEIDAIRFLRENGVDPVNRIRELCRVWPYYRETRRAVIAA